MSSHGQGSDNGWSIRYGDALSFWLFSRHPDDSEFDVVEAWIYRRQSEGPPRDGRRVLSDVYQAMVRPSSVIVTYLVEEDERVIIVREFY